MLEGVRKNYKAIGGGGHSSVDWSALTIQRFESQTYHQRSYSQILNFICHFIEKRTNINKKGGLYLKK